jgi:hypothetical protein
MLHNITKISSMTLPSVYGREIKSILNILPFTPMKNNQFRKRVVGRTCTQLFINEIIDNHVLLDDIQYIPHTPHETYSDIAYAPNILIQEFESVKYMIRNTIGYYIHNNLNCLPEDKNHPLYLDVHYHIIKDTIPFKKYCYDRDWSFNPLDNTIVYNAGVNIELVNIPDPIIKITHKNNPKMTGYTKLSQNKGFIVPASYFNIKREYSFSEEKYNTFIDNDTPSCSFIAIEISSQK